jgi:hypothetical protein
MPDATDMTAEKLILECQNTFSVAEEDGDWPDGYSEERYNACWNVLLARLRAYDALMQLAASYCDNTGGGCEDCGKAGSGKTGCPGRIIRETVLSARKPPMGG